MSLLADTGLAALRLLDPERAHGLAIAALRARLMPLPGPVTSDRLATRLAGLALPNPVGLAAGFDKNAEAVGPLMEAGFGFIEVGAATPRPQEGNPKPRLYRLAEDRAAINRFGFNNQGIAPIARRLAQRPPGIPVGLNLGANKDSEDRAGDFARVLREAGQIDFATVNVSSPNTERLRELQGAEALAALLDRVCRARETMLRPCPVFLKIAPDLGADEITEIAAVARESAIDGIIATNTTLARTGLRSAHHVEKGGLSGRPLFDRATRVLAQLSRALEGAMPIIGVGGVEDAETAFQKLRAGASAVQLYTALVYGGLGLVARIAEGLDERLAREGFGSVAEAVGTGRKDWL